VADITGLPPHLIRYHVERWHIPIPRQSHKVHYYSDVEIGVICDYFGVSCPTQLECLTS
jgi:hypothetical protein